MINYNEKSKRAWTAWLRKYGLRKVLDSFLANVEGAESTCVHCGEKIYVDIMIGGGVADWGTYDGDFGCPDSPDTNEEGTGGHMPRRKTNG